LKRDMDLVRTILLHFEEKKDFRHQKPEDFQFAGFDERTIAYHVDLMYEAGLLSCEATRSRGKERLVQAIPYRLTWQGHEFLDAARNPKVWEQAKSTFREKAIGMSFDLLREVLIGLSRAGLGSITS